MTKEHILWRQPFLTPLHVHLLLYEKLNIYSVVQYFIHVLAISEHQIRLARRLYCSESCSSYRPMEFPEYRFIRLFA